MLKTRRILLYIGMLTGSLAYATCVFAQTVSAPAAQYDEEHIVDVSKLKNTTIESLRSIEERLEKVNLKDKFDAVFEVLEADEIDNIKLKKSLEGLEQGVEEFRSDWDSTIEPLWKGHEMVGDTIMKVRTILAASEGSESFDIDKRKEIESYDKKLKNLSHEIMNEPDPKRQHRLKLLFKNLYNLRQIKKAKVNLSPASQIVLSRMIEALEHLELQFTRIIFTAEEAYAVLGNQQEFLQDYIQVVKGLVDIEDLAEWFAAGGTEESIATVEGLIDQFKGLNTSIIDFENAMTTYSGKMVENIEKHSQKIEENLKSVEGANLIDEELNVLIKEYAGREE